MSKKVIKVVNLSHSLTNNEGNQTQILNQITHQFPYQQITAIIGASGAGKTFLCKHLNGLLLPTTGQVEVLDFVIKSTKGKIKNILQLRKQIGYVSQMPERQMFEETVAKELVFGPVNFGFTKVAALQQGKRYLNALELVIENLKQSPFSFSGGQKRKIALASILAYEPQVVIFDASTAGLDLKSQAKLLQIMVELKVKYRKTVIFVTHNMNEVLAIADQVLVLDRGQKVLATTPNQLFADLAFCHKYHLKLPDTIQFVHQLTQAGFDTSQLDPRSFQTLTDSLVASCNQPDRMESPND